MMLPAEEKHFNMMLGYVLKGQNIISLFYEAIKLFSCLFFLFKTKTSDFKMALLSLVIRMMPRQESCIYTGFFKHLAQ